MAESYRGLTIRIGGDTSSLVKALRAPNQAISQTQAEIRKLGQALKLDPGNVQVISSQMGYMANQATNVSMKLAELKRAQEQIGKLKYTADDGSVQTVREMARATEEYGGAVSNVSEKLASNRTELNKLTERLSEAHNNMTTLARKAATVEQTKIADAFNLAAGITSVEKLTEKYSNELPNGVKRSEEQVRQLIADVERMRDAIGFKDGEVDIAAIKEALKDLPAGVRLSDEALSSLMAKLDGFNEAHGEAYKKAQEDVKSLVERQKELQKQVNADTRGIDRSVAKAQAEGEQLVNDAIAEGNRLIEEAKQAENDRTLAIKASEEAQKRLNEAESNLANAKGEEDAAADMVRGVEKIKAGLEGLSDDKSMKKLVEVAARDFDGFVDHVAKAKKELADSIDVRDSFNIDTDESVREITKQLDGPVEELKEKISSAYAMSNKLMRDASAARNAGDEDLFKELFAEAEEYQAKAVEYEARIGDAQKQRYTQVENESTRASDVQLKNAERVRKALEQTYILGGGNQSDISTAISEEIKQAESSLDVYKERFKTVLSYLRNQYAEYVDNNDMDSASMVNSVINDLTKQRDDTVNALKAHVSRLKTEQKSFMNMFRTADSDKYESTIPVEVYDEIQQKLQETKALRDAEKRSVDETTARLKAEGKSQQEITEAVADGVAKVEEFDAKIKELRSDLSAVSGGRGANLKGAFTEAYEKQHSNDEARESARASVIEEQAESIKQVEQDLDDARERHSAAQQNRLKAETALENARAEAAMKARAAEEGDSASVDEAKAKGQQLVNDAISDGNKLIEDAKRAAEESAAAEKAVDEAKVKGQQLVNDAIAEGNQLVEQAKQAESDRASAIKESEEAQKRLADATKKVDEASREESKLFEEMRDKERGVANVVQEPEHIREFREEYEGLCENVERLSKEYEEKNAEFWAWHEKEQQGIDAMKAKLSELREAYAKVEESKNARLAESENTRDNDALKQEIEQLKEYAKIIESLESDIAEKEKQHLAEGQQRGSKLPSSMELAYAKGMMRDAQNDYYSREVSDLIKYADETDAATNSIISDIKRLDEEYRKFKDGASTKREELLGSHDGTLGSYLKIKPLVEALDDESTKRDEDYFSKRSELVNRMFDEESSVIDMLRRKRSDALNAEEGGDHTASHQAYLKQLEAAEKDYNDAREKHSAAEQRRIDAEIEREKALRDAKAKSAAIEETSSMSVDEAKAKAAQLRADAEVESAKIIEGARQSVVDSGLTLEESNQRVADAQAKAAKLKADAEANAAKMVEDAMQAQDDAKQKSGETSQSVADAQERASQMVQDANVEASKMVQDAMQAQDDAILNLIRDQVALEQSTEDLKSTRASLADVLKELASLGGNAGLLSGEVFKNAKGNTNVDHMDETLRAIAADLGIAGEKVDDFVAKASGLVDGFKKASKEEEKLLKVTQYQDLVGEIVKSEAAVKSLAKQMSNMKVPSDLMRGMYELVEDAKVLDAAYKALSSTGASLSSAYKADPGNAEAATQAMNAYSAAEMVAVERARLLDKELASFDSEYIDSITDHTKSATAQLMEASKAAVEARQRYNALMGELNANNEKINQLNKEPAHVPESGEDTKQFIVDETRRVLMVERLEAANERLSEKIEKAAAAEREAIKNRDDAKMREEYEQAAAGVAQWHAELKKAAEAAREAFVQNSLREAFGDTSTIDRLRDRISSLVSSANAFENAFEFDPKNVDMATASMTRLQEAEGAATQRIAELSTKVSAMDTSKVDELREKYGSVSVAVTKIKEAFAEQDVARVNLSNAIANRLSEIDNGYESTMLRAMSESLMDPNAEFVGFQLDFLPESIRVAREEFVRLAKDGKASMQELADAEKALKFEHMQQELASARMELEKLMRQEHEIVVRLSLQGEFGDTTKITDALDGAMQAAMGRVGTFDNALKFDTKNVDLLEARMRAVTDAMNLGIRETAALKAAISQIDASAVEEMRSTYGSSANAVNMTTDAVNDLISKLAEQQARMDAADEGSEEYLEAAKNVETLKGELEEAQQASAKAAKYEQWERYNEQLAKVSAAMHGLNEDVREVAERNVEAFSANYSEGMFGDVDEQVASFDAAIQKAEERYRKYTDALAKEPHNKLFKDEQAKALAEAVDLTNQKVAYLKQTMSQFDKSKIEALKNQYGSFGKAVDDSKLKLKATEAEIETLKQKVAEFAAKNGKDAAWIRQFTDAKAEIKSIPPELEPVRARIVELFNVQGSQQLDVAIASVCSRLEEMGDEANTATAALRKALEGDGSSFMDSAAFTQAAQEMGQWARQAGQHIVDSANTIDSAYRDMRKTVNGTEEDFERIRQAAIDFSQTHAISADQMLEMEALGGQLGVLSHNLEQFGRLGSNISIATDIEANDAALQLGQMQNIMSDLENMDDLEHFGDALVRLGNNAAAQESAIMNVAQRIAAVGNVTSMSAPEVLGWSAAIAETGQRSESAATALSRTITGIGEAVNKGGSTLQNFAAIANMSTDEFKAAWENSSSDALKAFIVGLEGLTDSSTAAIQALDDVNISSVRQETALLALSQTVDNLDDNITMSKDAFNGMSDAWGDAGDAAREAQNKSEGFSGSLAIMQNNANNLAASLGDGLKPFLDLISGAMRTLTDLLNGMSPGMKSAVVTVGGLAMVLGTTVPIINQFRKGWTEMAQAIRNHVTISKATSKSMSEDSANTTSNTEAKVANTGATEANSVASETAGKAKQTEAAAAGENSTAMASDTASTEANTLATTENAAASEAAAAAKKREKSAALDSVDAMADAADSIDDVVDAVDGATDAADSMGDVAKEAKNAGKAADGLADTVDSVSDVADAATDAADVMGDVAEGAAKAGDAVGDVAKGADAVGDVVDAATDVADAVDGIAVAGGAAAGATGGLSASLAGLAATAGPMIVVAEAVVVLTDMLSKAAGVAGDYMLAMEAASDVSSIKDAFPDAQSLETTKTSLSELRSGFEGALNTIKSFGDAAQQSIDETDAGISVVEQYGAKIEELASQSKLTDAEQRLLEQTVTAFNDKTGAGIEIVDAATGKLNVMTGQVKELTEAYRVQAEQQAYTALYEEALKKQAEAQIEYDRAMGQFNATFGETVELMDILGDGPAMAFQKLADAFGMEAAANGAKKALEETGYSIDWLSDKIGSASFSFGSLESAMASAGLTTEQYSSLTDEQKAKLAEIQAALINAGHSLSEYKNLTANQLAQIIAAWSGSVPEILKNIEAIQKLTKATTQSEPPTVDYTAQSKARKKELEKDYNEQKKTFDKEYKQQQKALDRQYKAAQKASQKYLKEFKKAQSEEVEAFKAATDAKVKEIEREYEAKQKLLDQEYERYDSQYDDRIKAIEAEQDAEDEAKKQRERQEKLDELNKKVATARTAKARKEAEKELNDYLDDLRAEDTKKQRDAQIQKLKDQKSALKDQYDDRKKELKDSYDLAVSNYKAQREAELKLLQEKQEAEYEMVSEAEQAKLENLKETHQNALEELKQYHDDRLQEIKEANEAEVEAIANGAAELSQAAAETSDAVNEVAENVAAANDAASNGLNGLYRVLAQGGQISASEYVRVMQGVPGALSNVFENLGLTADEGTKKVAKLMLENGEITLAEYNNIMGGMPGATKAIANETGIALAAQLGLFGEDARIASQGLVDNVKYPLSEMEAYAKIRAAETAKAVAGMGSQENADAAASGAGNLVNAVNSQFTGITKPAELASVQIPGALANVGSQENSDAVAKSTGNLVNAVNSQFTGITKPAEAASAQIPAALTSMGSQENVDAVANSTGNLVKGVNAQFKDMGKYAEAAGANVPPALASGIGKNADDAARISASMVKGVAETTNSIEKPMSTYGANASIGWLNEFSKYAQQALNYVGQWANNILASVAVPHMINSPSRKFAWMARMDLEGFRKGWEQNEDGTLRMVGGTADALTGAFSPSLDANADFMQSLLDDMRSKEGELLRQAQRMAEIVERGFDPELTVDAAYEAIDRIDRGRLRRQQMVASSQSVDNSTYAPVLNFTINATVREEADIDMISNKIAVKVQRQLNSRIG